MFTVSPTWGVDLELPDELSFFDPYIRHSVREVIDVGGEAYVAKDARGVVSGVFIYDPYERTGTVYTRSREVFDHFYALRPFDILFSEVRTEHESEVYDIYTIDLEASDIVHRFRYEISTAEGCAEEEVGRFMVSTHPGMNRKWVSVASKSGDTCLVIRLGEEIAGLGWLSLVDRVGRLHTLYVKPQYRGMGMGEDILFARLLWLKSMHASWAFSEISRDNPRSSRVAVKGHMRVSGQVFQYGSSDALGGSRSSRKRAEPAPASDVTSI